MEEVNERRLYVGGLTEQITKYELDELFRRFGNIVDLWICARNQTKFAFVEFEDVQDAIAAIESLHGSTVNDRRIIVAASKKRKASNNECFNCGLSGHFARDCQEKTRKRGRHDHSSSSSPKKDNKMSRRDRSNSRTKSPSRSSFHSRMNSQGYNYQRKPHSRSNQSFSRSRRSRSRSDGVESHYSSSTAPSAHGDSPSYRQNYRGQSRDRMPSVIRKPSGSHNASSFQITENFTEERWSLSPQKPSQSMVEQNSISLAEDTQSLCRSSNSHLNDYEAKSPKNVSPSITDAAEEEWN